jgi:hypothetical protein
LGHVSPERFCENNSQIAFATYEIKRVIFLDQQNLSRKQGLMKDVFVVQRQRVVQAPPLEVYRVITGLGCQRGWLAFNWAWQLRGTIDGSIGGIGMRCGRRHPDELLVGDTVDFWRVEALEPNHLLRLYAEVILPGQGWLQFEIKKEDDNMCSLIQKASFIPDGLFGHLYWLVLLPIHSVIFSTLIRKIAELAEYNHKVSLDVLAKDDTCVCRNK